MNPLLGVRKLRRLTQQAISRGNKEELIAKYYSIEVLVKKLKQMDLERMNKLWFIKPFTSQLISMRYGLFEIYNLLRKNAFPAYKEVGLTEAQIVRMQSSLKKFNKVSEGDMSSYDINYLRSAPSNMDYRQPTAYQLTIYCKTFPSKKNSKQAVFKGGRTMILSSNEYTSWEKTATINVMAWMQNQKVKHGAKFPLEHAALSAIFYFPDSRRRDLTNCIEGVNDVLVDCGVLSDDCWKVLSPITIKGRISKTTPRIELRISQPESDYYER